MTMQEITRLTDWKQVFKGRTVYAVTTDGQRVRVISVGRKYVRLLHGDGMIEAVEPVCIRSIIL